MNDLSNRITQLEQEIAQLEAQLPAHSVKPWMLQRIEDLEEELVKLKQQALERPIPASYWVEPGRFLAGEYPGSPRQASMRKRVTTFLRLGFDTFIDLTADGEREPYEPLLQQEGPLYGLDVTYQRFSIGDFGLPSSKKMIEILDSIDAALASGRKVYVHCWAGVGRTGTTVGCYLSRHGLSGEQALRSLAEKFRTAEHSRYHATSPETNAQIDFVLNWQE